MTITELPAVDLCRMLKATERAAQPDPYALDALRRELQRRLDTSRPTAVIQEGRK